MSNEDKRRRRDGSTAQLSVAELLARREAETQEIPVYREVEEDTVRFKPVTPPAALATAQISRQSLSGRELHVAELLRREGRPADEERGGLKISKLVAIASGGVVLAGTVAFGVSSWLGSPDERPLADVRFDDRPAARNSNNTGGIGALALPGTTSPSTTDTSTTQQQTQEQQATQQQTQQRTAQNQTQQQAPAAQTPGTQTTTTTTESTTQQPTTDKGTTTAPSTTTPPPSTSTSPSTSTPPASGSTTPPSSSTPPSSEAPSTGIDLGTGLGLDLGVKLGGFDFFAEA
ncbi:hypothetical protein ACFFQW_32965 [Umezawaea endophytica]|uniref:Uncharacterized protein n=1 Tax=Umezawaea endophytica TaxID=1654476 RepID=A0A9X3AHX1_9PSEU|nr:hypothetical protein [Umezawaea endophytica]MCS7482252.1 hypothetical protein [Umezawaea endophytica]